MQKMLTAILFVRHAQPLQPYSDDRTRPLTEEGLADRKVVLDTLKDRHIDAFLCSPYKRSIDTIRTAADHFGMEIRTDERFRERRSGIGAFKMLKDRWADFSFAEEYGESLGSTQARNIAALTDVLREYAGRTVVIGTHGTALSTILHFYDPSFGMDGFLGLLNKMPYIMELTFEGERYLGRKELAYVEKPPLKIDFAGITACGEYCSRCMKRQSGACPGCIEADGAVPEWKESGKCRIHACVHAHGVPFCGLCHEFPCDNVTSLISWDPNIVPYMTFLKDQYMRQDRK